MGQRDIRILNVPNSIIAHIFLAKSEALSCFVSSAVGIPDNIPQEIGQGPVNPPLALQLFRNDVGLFVPVVWGTDESQYGRYLYIVGQYNPLDRGQDRGKERLA